MTQSTRSHALHDLGYKIFLDRYALKDMTRETLAVGDTVVALVDPDSRQREIGTVEAIDLPHVTITLRDGTEVTCNIEEVDKPLETDPGQMMDRVARGVAAVEATEGARAHWAERFRWLLEDWKFVPGGRILAAAGTDQQLTYYNCMPPEQEILTVDGYKPIGDVRIGELVVTHRNRLRPIRRKFERETNEPLYIINPKKIGYDSLRVTGEHKVYVIRSKWVNSHRSRDGLHLKHEPDWAPAKDLKHGDFVAVAYDGEECTGPATLYVGEYLPKYEVENGRLFKSTARGEHGYVSAWGTHYSLNNELVVDAELCSLFGRWLGDGCITHRTGTDIPSGIKIVFNLDELGDAEEIARIFEDKFGITPSIKLSSTERWYDLWVNSMPVGEFFKSFLGVYSHSKRIPSELMHLPDELTIALLRGLFRADGYISGNALGMLLSNRELMMQVHQMLLRLGYFFSIKENTHENGRVPAYRVQATSNECGSLFERFFDIEAPPYEMDLKYYLEYGGLRWVRIDSIEVEDYSGVVMDIEVEEDHSFVSAGVVVSNCYVVPMPHDSRDGIIETLRQMTEIMSRGGGVGINISRLRPRYAYVRGVNGRSSGTVSWGELYSFVTGLIEQGGSRRGALMLILNDWHPDIYEFVNVKRNMDRMTNANISVGVSDRLMEAVEIDGDWDLVFPDTDEPDYDDVWNGDLDTWIAGGHKVVHYDTVKARDLWNAIIESAWASAEPGIWFRERTNKFSNSYYFSPLICTNPCGEQPLSAWSVCNLGAINLARFYDAETGDVAWDDLRMAARCATRFLDNVIDTTPYFFEENRQQQLNERRVGLGTMGLAELMIRLGIRYGSDESLAFIDKLYEFLATTIYEMSTEIAQEKESFPQFDVELFLQSGYMQQMPERIRDLVRERGIRNVTLMTQAPTGTTGTLVNTSTGIEPFFSWSYFRKSRLGMHEEQVPLVRDWYAAHPETTELPDYFVTAMDLTPLEHVKVQAAIQRWVDSAISKTSNVPNEYTVEQTRELYESMYRLGCKGGTIYRDGSRNEQVLMLKEEEKADMETTSAKNGRSTLPGTQDMPQVASPNRVDPRPKLLTGVTVSVKTPFGTGFITMNTDEEGNPFEVFVTIGKAGSDLQADAEGLGRMISLLLRTTARQNRLEMLKLIIDQLRNIGGVRSVGLGNGRVSSLPDAVASTLEQFYLHGGGEQLQLPGLADGPQPVSHSGESALAGEPGIRHDSARGSTGAKRPSGMDMCPACGTISLVRAEGCQKCLACGYSEC